MRRINGWNGLRRVAMSAAFVLAVAALAGFGLYQVAGRQWAVQPTFHVQAEFDTIAGLEAGNRVRLQGIDAGVVERVVPPDAPGKPVRLVLRIDARLHSLVRADAIARIVSEGLVGAKAVELAPGTAGAPVVANQGRIGSERPLELADLAQKAGESLARLDDALSSARTGLDEIHAIAQSVRQGRGSLGKLVQDDKLYRDLDALSHRGERTLVALEENLDSLKHVWPLSRYFNHRAYFDRDRLLFQPGAERASRSVRAEELFPPGKAVLTQHGRALLDGIARWCKKTSRPASEVVIAAFTDDDRDQGRAEILTQEQADSVRKYLTEQHKIQSAGWFRHRKVAAVGFGTHVPPAMEDASPQEQQPPPRRVDIIVFTPQA